MSVKPSNTVSTESPATSTFNCSRLSRRPSTAMRISRRPFKLSRFWDTPRAIECPITTRVRARVVRGPRLAEPVHPAVGVLGAAVLDVQQRPAQEHGDLARLAVGHRELTAGSLD